MKTINFWGDWADVSAGKKHCSPCKLLVYTTYTDCDRIKGSIQYKIFWSVDSLRSKYPTNK